MDRAGGSRTTRKVGLCLWEKAGAKKRARFARKRSSQSSLGERRPGLVALVGHEGRWVTLGGLVFICTRYPLVDAD